MEKHDDFISIAYSNCYNHHEIDLGRATNDKTAERIYVNFMPKT